MTYKILPTLLLAFFSFQVHADQLHNFSEIKNTLSNGQPVQAIIDLKQDCRMLSSHRSAGAPPLSVPDTFSIQLDGKHATHQNIINANASSLNPATPSLPAHFVVTGITIQPFGNITVNIQTLGFENRQLIQQVVYSCKMDNGRGKGIKFMA